MQKRVPPNVRGVLFLQKHKKTHFEKKQKILVATLFLGCFG